MAPLSTDKILESVKRRAMLPDSDATFSDENLLEMVNEELRYFAVPHILRAYQEYLVYFEDFDVDSDTYEYEIPYRAVGNKIRSVFLYDNSQQFRELSRISIDDLAGYKTSFGSSGYDVFYVENNKIVFPSEYTSNSTKLRIYFYLEPNNLVSEDRVPQITDINTTTGVLTLDFFPDHFANLPDMDFIAYKNPNKIIDYDIVPSAVNTNAKTITFSPADLPAGLKINDFIASAGETKVLQLPKEFQNIIAQRVAVQALESLGDEQNKVSAERRLKEMEESLLQLISNRTEGEPEKINPRRSLLRGGVSSSLGRRRGL